MKSKLIPRLKSLLIIGLILSLASCYMCDDPIYCIEPELSPYVLKFYEEAEARGIALQRDNLVVVRKAGLKQFGLTRHGLGQTMCWINKGFAEAYPEYSAELEVIVFHELGHALLDLKHIDGHRNLMESTPNITYYRGKPEVRSKTLDELFGI
jgi:hypothetical protein